MMNFRINVGERPDGSFDQSYWIRVDDRFGREAVSQIEEQWSAHIENFASVQNSADKRIEQLDTLEGDIGVMIVRTYLDAAEFLAQEAGNPGKALERIDVVRLAFERAVSPDGVAGDDIGRKLASNGFERLLVAELEYSGVPGFERASAVLDVKDPFGHENADSIPEKEAPSYA